MNGVWLLPHFFWHGQSGDMLANDLISRLILPARQRPCGRPDFREAVALVNARYGRNLDIQLVVHSEVTGVIVIDHDVHLGPVCRDVLYDRIWIHPADCLQDENLLSEDGVFSLNSPKVLRSFGPH